MADSLRVYNAEAGRYEDWPTKPAPKWDGVIPCAECPDPETCYRGPGCFKHTPPMECTDFNTTPTKEK